MPVRQHVKTGYQVAKQSFNEFLEDKCPRLGAALAYYTIFSIAPLLIIVSGVAGIFLGQQQTRDRVTAAVSQLATPQAGEVLSQIFKPGSAQRGMLATIIGAVSLIFGATGVFTELQDSLNTIWGVTPKPGRGLWGILRDRFLSFSMVGGILFLLLTSLIVTTVIEAMGHWLIAHTGPEVRYLLSITNFLVSYLVIALLFAMIYKILPDVTMAWRDVWLGAAVTALLFVIGKLGLGLYLGHASIGSVYGAAGSLLVLLTWIYYSAQIFLLGAEFVQVWVKERGDKFVPNDNAIPLTHSARAVQGIPVQKELHADAIRAGHCVDDEQLPHPLANGFDLEAHRARSRKKHRGDGSWIPMALSFAAGFLTGRSRKEPTSARLVLRKRRIAGLRSQQAAA